MNNKIIAIIIILAVAAIALYSSAYIIDETEQVVVTRFGEVIGEAKTDPGLYFKLPVVDIPNFFPKNLQEWDGDPGQIPTLDKTYIWVDTFGRWKIVDPIKFFQTAGNMISALNRLDEIIDPAVRNFVTSYSLIETVRKSNRELIFEFDELKQDEAGKKATKKQYAIEFGRQKITEGIMKQAQPKLSEFGIELVDVEIKRINYVQEVRRSVYDRMIAERKQIAEKFRSEGQGEARKWQGKKERELKRITSGAYKTAQVIKGKADAKVTKTLANAFGMDPEFYSFIKTLEIYNSTFDKESTVVLSTDSEFLKYLKGYKK
ncbi:MAG: protease modulator HflC [Deltaproteobacteria bacterium]|nr:protease modulator HflC [Deltaproteobacteria bacterium]